MEEPVHGIEIEPVESPASLLKLIKKFGSDAPLKRIFQIVLQQNCKTILVENNYDDDDYKVEYESYYKYLFQPPPDKAKRLHFFSCEIKKDDISTLSRFQTEYLGFCVLRPFERQKVVSAVIKPVYDNNEPKHSFLLCIDHFPVKIEVPPGNIQNLTVEGFPFMQQDGQYGRCAHVSLATIDRFLSFKSGKEASRLNEIVKTAEKVPELQSEVPGPGLTPYQISLVLREMGYKAVIYCYGPDEKPRFSAERVIYHYMESKIPVMLGIKTKIGWHVVTVVGHSFEPDIWWALAKRQYFGRSPSGGQYHCSTTWIESIIINDDNFGPYMTLPKWILSAIDQTNLMVVVPLPRSVNVQGEDIEEKAFQMVYDESVREYMEKNKKDLQPETKDWYHLFLRHASNGDLVLRTYLLDSEEFKTHYPLAHLQVPYGMINMPPKIWLTEVSIPELFGTLRQRMGEIITDSTRSVRFGDTFLALHLPGVLALRDAQTGQRSYYTIPHDPPISHLTR